jgi:Sulfite reductase, alpha subunit (flavoprotein)
VRLLPLNRLDAAALTACRKISFVVSTTGDGDVPDAGVRFVEQVMRQRLKLKSLRYAVLALGNRDYSHYCAFGRGLDAWLADCGARARFPRIDVDNHDADALTAWHDALGLKELGITAAPPETAAWQTATLVARRHLNPGSAGEPAYWVELELPALNAQRAANDWEAGDIIDLRLAADPAPRSYTLATLPDESDSPQTRSLGLIVRQQRRSDGSLGVLSGWLTHTAQPGDCVSLKLRAQPNFRIDGNTQRPLILIGNGTGLAGLVAHLKARADHGGPPCWLIFGERHAAHDFLLQDRLERWRDDGVLARLDGVFRATAAIAPTSSTVSGPTPMPSGNGSPTTPRSTSAAAASAWRVASTRHSPISSAATRSTRWRPQGVTGATCIESHSRPCGSLRRGASRTGRRCAASSHAGRNVGTRQCVAISFAPCPAASPFQLRSSAPASMTSSVAQPVSAIAISSSSRNSRTRCATPSAPAVASA